MIQFNLLPDVKLQYIKTQHTKRLVMVISIVAAAVSFTALVIMFLTVQVGQKKHLTDITKDIGTQENKLINTQDLNKILTIQNQLQSLPDLHAGKPIASRIFNYIQLVTPRTTTETATISSLNVDFVANTISINGSADSLITANKFADALKFATYSTSKVKDAKPFSNIVSTLALNSSDKAATFTFSFGFDPVLFKNDDVPTLTVPNQISTRSVTEKPEAIFKQGANDTTNTTNTTNTTTTKAGTN